ncbi:MAG: HAMP domain-containing histidine kinase [Candidatus Obscuribacterales bacterium]|nr:HAMP domain-containing histidine kinase [Candidatus Obscuribacterales bacterium]
MQLRLKIFHKGLILVSVPLLFEFIFIFILVGLLQQAESEIQKESRAKEILAKIDLTRRSWTDMGFALAIYKFNGSQLLRRRYQAAKQIIKKEYPKLEALVGNGSRKEMQLMEILKTNMPLALDDWNNVYLSESGPAAMSQLFGHVTDQNTANSEFRRIHEKPLMKVRCAGDELADIQARIADSSPLERAKTRQRIEYALMGGLAANVLITILLTFYLSKSISSRLAGVTDNTQKLAKRQALNPLVGGSDEIAVLDNCLHKTANELTELENFKREMMSMVSHELRTPLSSVVMILKLLSAGALGVLPEKAIDRIRAAETNADRLIRLINDLLDMERMEAGKLEMAFDECSLEDLFNQAIESVKEFAQKYEVTLKREGEGPTMYIDHDRILQVLINLLSNAIKYSPQNSEVILMCQDHQEFVEISVIDKGRGIPEAFKDKIFEKFQQVDQRDPREKKGSGLGLAISKAIVEEHRGSMGLESETGKGSRFWFRIPKTLKPEVLISVSS